MRRCLLAFATACLSSGGCASTAPTGGVQGTDPVDIHVLSSSPTAEVTVDWSDISFTAEGVQLPRRQSHGCHDTRARRCGTWQLAPGTYTFNITSRPVAERTETSVSITMTPPQRISVPLAAGHDYIVQRVRVYDATAKLCWYADNTGAAERCRND